MDRACSSLPHADLQGKTVDVFFDKLLTKEPLSFLKTIAPIDDTGCIHKCLPRAQKTYDAAKLLCSELGPHCPLSVDGLAAILKYCAEDADPPFYNVMNSACYDQDRSKLVPFVPYMWLLLQTLAQLPPYPGTEVYRGVKLDLSTEYNRRKREGRLVTWWSYTSCTKTEEVLTRHENFLGRTGKGTLFIIQLTQRQARDISDFSPLPEGEVLLPPGCEFKIGAIITRGDLTVVTLHEVKSENWIVDMGSVPVNNPSLPRRMSEFFSGCGSHPPVSGRKYCLDCGWWKAVQGFDTEYRIVTEGTGDKVVSKGNKVTVHATGVLFQTEKKFWSTKDPGHQPFTYDAGVGGVITGWDQGCLGMKIGEVRELIIPATEAYGVNGFPAWGIPARADLSCTVECLRIQ